MAHARLTPSFLGVRGRDWTRASRRQRHALLTTAFGYWRQRGFPYFDLATSDIAREFGWLRTQAPTATFTRAGALGSIVGLRLANYFHPHMWSVRVSRYRSPMDVFRDDELLLAALERAWRVWPDRFGANPSSLRRMLKTFPGTASVSNFRPTLARAIISRYSPAAGVVVDFSAGFGGRLVGALSLNRRYVGIEPSARQVAGLRRTIRALEGIAPDSTASIHHGCAEDVMRNWPTSRPDLVFSSPPYYDWERYSGHRTQSYRRYRSYAEWLTGFLEPVIECSYAMLKPGGRLVLNVSNGQRLPTPEVVERLAKTVGFRLEDRLPLLLARVPYLHPRSSNPYKPELLIVFRKTARARR
jgi:hypothetical protein